MAANRLARLGVYAATERGDLEGPAVVAQLAGDRVDPLGLRAVGRLSEEALDADGPLCQRQNQRLCPNARWVWIGNTYLDDSGRDGPASLNSTGDM